MKKKKWTKEDIKFSKHLIQLHQILRKNNMTDNDIRKLEQIAIDRLSYIKNLSKDEAKKEAIQSFYKAGIMNLDGSFTEPYQLLEELFKNGPLAQKDETR
jgi:hypothetical protein